MKAIKTLFTLSVVLFLSLYMISCSSEDEAAINSSAKQFVGCWSSTSAPTVVLLDKNGYCYYDHNIGTWHFNSENDALSINAHGQDSYLWTIATSSPSTWTGITPNGKTQGFSLATKKELSKTYLFRNIFDYLFWEDNEGKSLISYIHQLMKDSFPPLSHGCTFDGYYALTFKGSSEFYFTGDNSNIDKTSFELDYIITYQEINEKQQKVSGTVSVKNINDLRNMKLIFDNSQKEFHIKPDYFK